MIFIFKTVTRASCPEMNLIISLSIIFRGECEDLEEIQLNMKTKCGLAEEFPPPPPKKNTINYGLNSHGIFFIKL